MASRLRRAGICEITTSLPASQALESTSWHWTPCRPAVLKPDIIDQLLCTLAVEVNLHDRGVGHGVLHVKLIAECIEGPVKHVGFDLVTKSLEEGVLFAELCRQIAPWTACLHNPLHGFDNRRLLDLALHRQACQGDFEPSIPTVCHSMLFFL
ncbi:MAG: hypothetical protein Q4A11_05010 [Brachymonas sp.]|nr:hypothetical protein [Brachymonas sp.]